VEQSDSSPPRRRRWPLVAAAAVACVVALVVWAGVLLGVVPGLSALAGTAAPVDLGVRYGPADLAAGLENLTVTDGGASLDTTLTQAELTALANDQAQRAGVPVSRVQIRVRPQDRFEASASARVLGRDVPVYVAGRAQATDGGTVRTTLSDVRVGGLSLPGALRGRVETAVRDEVIIALTNAEGFTFEVLQTGEGSLRIRGVVGGSQ
jgi:hypothetical protein